MHHIRIATLFAFVLGLPLLAGDFSIETAGAPEGVLGELGAAVAEEGVAVKSGDTVVANYWGRKDAFEGTPSAGFGIRYDNIPEGAFLALIQFTPKRGTISASRAFRPGGTPCATRCIPRMATTWEWPLAATSPCSPPPPRIPTSPRTTTSTAWSS